MTKFEKNKLKELIKILKDLPKIKEVKALRKRLENEIKKLEQEKIPKPKLPKEEIKAKANQNRSAKQKRYWRYVKLIRDNFPNLPTNEIRKQLKERKQGQQTEIPDVIWQNPSP